MSMNCPGLTEVSELLKKTKYACNALRLLVLLVEHDGVVVVVSALAPPLFAHTVRFKPRQLISSNYTGALAKLTSKHENSHSALPEVIYSVGVPLNKINESLQKIFQTATF